MNLLHAQLRRAALAAGVALALVPAASASAAVVQPLDAGTVADGIGVNTHLTYNRSAYGNYTGVRAALDYLGVKHVRDVLAAADGGKSRDQYNAVLKYLADNDGLKYLLHQPDPVAGGSTPAQLAATAATTLRGAVEGIEGVNEFDLSGFADWPTRLFSIQSQLKSAVRARPELAAVPVLGPSLGHTNSWAAGNLSSVSDLGNTHPYPGSRRPADWRNLTPSMNLSTYVHGAGKAMWATETGYHNATKDTTTFEPVSERASGVYMPQLLLAGAYLGLKRQYIYQLLDDTPDTTLTQRDRHFGLFHTDFTPKPAAVTVSRMIDLYGGTPGAAPRAGLDYTIEGAPDVVSLLSQRADGTWLLAMWRNLPLWDNATRRELYPATARATVRFAASADVQVQRLSTQAAPVALANATTSVALDVPADNTTVLLIRPAGR